VPDEPVQLYDLIADPMEHENLAVAKPAVRGELAKLLDRWYMPDAGAAAAEEKSQKK
jgi:hypothetical protein